MFFYGPVCGLSEHSYKESGTVFCVLKEVASCLLQLPRQQAKALVRHILPGLGKMEEKLL
jgi:hypothetical protein